MINLDTVYRVLSPPRASRGYLESVTGVDFSLGNFASKASLLSCPMVGGGFSSPRRPGSWQLAFQIQGKGKGGKTRDSGNQCSSWSTRVASQQNEGRGKLGSGEVRPPSLGAGEDSIPLLQTALIVTCVSSAERANVLL